MKILRRYSYLIIAFLFFFGLSIYAFLYRPKTITTYVDNAIDFTSLSFKDSDYYPINDYFYPDTNLETPDYNCYKLKLNLPENVHDLAFRIPQVFKEMSFYVNDELIYAQGDNVANTVPIPHILISHIEDYSTIELKLYVKRSEALTGISFLNPVNTNDFLIGTPNAVFNYQKKSDLSNLIVVIICFLCALYNILALRYKGEQLSHLHLALFSISISVCLLFFSQGTIHYFISNIGITLFLKIYIFSFFLKVMSLLAYICDSLNIKSKRIIINTFSTIAISLTIITIFVSNDSIHFIIPIIYILLSAVIVIGIVYSLYELKNNPHNIIPDYLLIGLFACLSGLYSEYLFVFSDHSFFSNFSLCQLFFVILQSVIISKQYQESVNAIKSISPKLQESLNELQTNPSTYISSHIKPLFLYETLESIEKYIDTDSDKVDRLIQALAKYLRQALDFTIDPIKYSLTKEIDNCKAYSELINEQFPEINFTFDIEENLPDTFIPQQAILAIMENAVLNAFKGILHPEVLVKVSREEDLINILVKDNGIGMTANEISTALQVPSPNFEICLYYINLQLVENYDSRLKINSSIYKTGTSVSFSIPIIEKANSSDYLEVDNI